MSMRKDEERLDLLKEIGGSKVYEDRRNESLKILHEADSRKRQISELVCSADRALPAFKFVAILIRAKVLEVLVVPQKATCIEPAALKCRGKASIECRIQQLTRLQAAGFS